jgi:hypothetical protein
MATSWIAILSMFLSGLFGIISMLQIDSFWGSMSLINIYSFISMLWFAPVFTMLQDSCSQKNQGFIVSIYFLLTTGSGIVSTALLGNIHSSMNAQENP